MPKPPLRPTRRRFVDRHWIRSAACAIGTVLAASATACAQETGKSLDLTGLVSPASGPFAGKRFYTGSHVLIVGVSRYKYLSRYLWLHFADRDARELRDLLIRSYGVPAQSITLLLNEQATRSNIEDAINGFADSGVGADDRVLIYFSGHGQTVPTSAGGEMGFLIPYDAKVDLAKPQNKGGYLSTCIAMDSLWSRLGLSAARHALVIADACYGGLMIRGKALGGERPTAPVIAALLSRPAREVLTAGGAGETALEDPRLGHGTFTYKLLEELRAQAATPNQVFTATELAAALRTSVGNLTNAHQTPQFGSYNTTEGDFLFVTTPPRPVTPIVEAAPAPPLPPVAANVLPPPTLPNVDKPTPPIGRPPAADGSSSILTKTNEKDGAEMVFVPAGPFEMGDSDRGDNPRHTVTLSGYYIYKNLVTVAMYRKFCDAAGRQMPDPPSWGWKDDHPMVNVSWDDAKAYCAWAGARLPTEAEWEKAARGTDGRKFPWGDEFDKSRLWCSVKGLYSSTAPVGSFPAGASPFGVLDMAGNVDQWCSDYYDADYTKIAATNPIGPGIGENRVLRGGWWGGNGDGAFFRVAYRYRGAPATMGGPIGFRAVVSAAGVP